MQAQLRASLDPRPFLDAPTPRTARMRGFFRRPSPLLIACLACTLLIACQGGSKPRSGSGNPVGASLNHPDPSLGSLRFVVDANSGGDSTNLRALNLSWGRLADVRDQLGILQQTDMVIGDDITNDGVDFLLSTNAITLRATVTIRHPYSPSTTSPYQRAFKRLDRNLIPVDDKSLDPSEIPPFSLVPRNAAVVVQFNDLLDPTLINAATIKLLAGYPPIVPQDVRAIRDINHGDTKDTNGDGIPEFYPTRVILDMTVSPIEAAAVDPPLPVNVLGLPASITQNQPNVALRIATRTDLTTGQVAILRNLSGHAVANSGSGSVDASSPTLDVVRAMRSGGSTSITGDVNNGFLVDLTKPKVVGSQAVIITVPAGDPDDFATDLTYTTTACAAALKIGDVVEQPGVFAEVIQPTVAPVAGTIPNVHCRIVFPVDGHLQGGQAVVSSVFDPVANQSQLACFVHFPNISSPPAAGVATKSPVRVRFSEPMDPARLTPFDTLTLTRNSTNPAATDFIVGHITPSSDFLEFEFKSELLFKHTSLSTEPYFVNLASGPTGPTDLAGNPLANALPQVQFNIAPSESTQNNGGLVLRFTSMDEIPDAGNKPEVRGQVFFDIDNARILPRAVTRFAAVADRTQAVVANMTTAATGQQTPLAGLGSKLQTVWRYCDVGFMLRDETKYNVDVEGLGWAPRAGAAIADVFPRFEISLAHSSRLPDEGTQMVLMMILTFPQSGLLAPYAGNLLDAATDPLHVVHARSRGYILNPADRFISDTGTIMMPFPLNRGIPHSDFQYYTWRDTALQAVGDPDGPGAEMAIVSNLGLSVDGIGVPYGSGLVPTVGLPLLLEFKCFPDNGALGLNTFDVSNVTGGGQPKFRAFSTGGINASNQAVIRDPDLELSASGGFQPNPLTGAPGQMTPGIDNVFYIGQMNLVTRVSRAYSIWFNTGGAIPVYTAPVIEPRATDQPLGTQVLLAFRGATGVNVTGLTNDATLLDTYGEPIAGANATFTNGDKSWRSSMSSLFNSRFFQVRFSFVANADTSLTPSLSGVGFAWRF